MINLDPSSHWGYERKHAALHGAEDYGEAINAVLRMLSNIENSPDEEIRRMSPIPTWDDALTILIFYRTKRKLYHSARGDRRYRFYRPPDLRDLSACAD